MSKGKEETIGSLRIKATFRMDPESIATLEVERLRRIKAGVPRSEADLSDLVNEAIRKAFPKSGTARAQARALREEK